jgi:hypothetical protein
VNDDRPWYPELALRHPPHGLGQFVLISAVGDQPPEALAQPTETLGRITGRCQQEGSQRGERRSSKLETCLGLREGTVENPDLHGFVIGRRLNARFRDEHPDVLSGGDGVAGEDAERDGWDSRARPRSARSST